MPSVNIATLPRSSTITPDLYLLGVRDPDGAAFNELILAQGSGTGGSGGGSGKILVDTNNTIFPNRPRLKLTSDVFVFFDDPGNDQTLLGFNTSVLMQKADYDSDGDNIIGLANGGTGLSVPSNEAGLFGASDSGPVLYKTNYFANSIPTINDDSTEGYAIGSRWIFGPSEWLCTDATASNAKWSKTTGSGTGGGAGSNLNIQVGGINLPNRPNLNFLGSGLTLVYDDPANDAIIVQIEQGDMTKSVYDADLDNIIDAKAGGTGLDLANSAEGFLYSLPQADTPPILLRQSFGTFAQPSSSSDASAGFGFGSLWLDRGNDSLWYNVDATPGNAQWQRIGKARTFFDDTISLPYKEDLIFKGFSISQTTDAIIIEQSENLAVVEWADNPLDSTLSLRDSLHGKTIRLAGTHDVLCPSSQTATIRDGFQINVILVTPNSTITFFPEDSNTTINGRSNILNEQWGSVHLSYDANQDVWYAIGFLS